jgi:hypothetical protein
LITGIVSKNIDKYWNSSFDRFTERALKYSVSGFTTEDIKLACKEQDMQLWISTHSGILNGVCITQILTYPRKKNLLILLLAGNDFKEWQDEGNERMVEYAKANNCRGIEFHGRKGWRNLLKDNNYKEQHVVFYKEIV